MSKNNAFRSSRAESSSSQSKGFLETHGMALGGGVLALGMMIVGSQYMQQENLSADVTTETETEVVATAEPGAETEAPATEEIASTESETETASTEEVVVPEENETIDEAVSTETEETITDDSEEASADENTDETAESTATENTSVITNPVTQNIAPLYADPVDEGNVEAITPIPTPTRESVGDIPFVPQSPSVPLNVLNAVPVSEGSVDESQE